MRQDDHPLELNHVAQRYRIKNTWAGKLDKKRRGRKKATSVEASKQDISGKVTAGRGKHSDCAFTRATTIPAGLGAVKELARLRVEIMAAEAGVGERGSTSLTDEVLSAASSDARSAFNDPCSLCSGALTAIVKERIRNVRNLLKKANAKKKRLLREKKREAKEAEKMRKRDIAKQKRDERKRAKRSRQLERQKQSKERETMRDKSDTLLSRLSERARKEEEKSRLEETKALDWMGVHEPKVGQNPNELISCTFKDPKSELSSLISHSVGVVDKCSSFDAQGHSFCPPVYSEHLPLSPITATGIEIWDFLCTFSSLLGFEPVSLDIFQLECGFLAREEVPAR